MKIKKKLLLIILAFALTPIIAISLAFYTIGVGALKEQIKEDHYKAVSAVDTTIFVVVSDMVNIAFTAVPEIIHIIEENNEQQEIIKERLKERLNIIDQTNVPGIGTGRGLGYQIVILTDEQGNILARSNIVEGVKKEVSQKGHILYLDEERQEKWNHPENFGIALENALRGESDARKIIFDAAFLRREGYRHLVDEYGFKEMMGLTAFQPVFGQDGKQIGMLLLVTILNNNHTAIGAIHAITGSEFTAITPTGEIIASYFVNPPTPDAEIVRKAKERIEAMIRREKKPTGEDSVFYTKERIYLRHCLGKVVFRGAKIGTCYINGNPVAFEELEERAYRLNLIAEVDSDFKYVSIRGIAYDLTAYDQLMSAQARSFATVFLLTFLVVGGLGLTMAKRITLPIVNFTKEIQEIEKQGFGRKKIEIKTGDEIEDLANSFNSMSETIAQSYKDIEEQKNVLEIRVDAKTKTLKELADTLDKQVKEKTRTLQERINELERLHKTTIDREIRMVEMKKEIEELKQKLGEAA